MKAMIFAAGKGTRLLDETTDKPKALVEVAGKPLLQHAIEKLSKEGIDEIVINIHHFSYRISEWLEKMNFNIPVHISDETAMLLDTGGALKKAAPMLADEEPVLIYNVDVLGTIVLRNVIEDHKKSGALATLVVRDRQTQRYFKFDDQQRLIGWVNKKTGEMKMSRPAKLEDAKEMAFSGIHVIGQELFRYFPEENKFSITHFYLKMAEQHLIKGYYDESDIWMDVGKPHELEEARKRYGR